MSDQKQICAVLNRHPDVTTIEDAICHCEAEGVEAGFWALYFAAREAGRKLIHRPPATFSQAELRDLALIFLGLHKGREQAFATLDKLQEMNNVGTRVDWHSEKTKAMDGWELSVAQELADYADGIQQARQVVNKL